LKYPSLPAVGLLRRCRCQSIAAAFGTNATGCCLQRIVCPSWPLRHRLQVALGAAAAAAAAAAAMSRVPTASDTSSAADVVVVASVAGQRGRVVELLDRNTCSENVLSERGASKC
jgi:hypothetical protein